LGYGNPTGAQAISKMPSSSVGTPSGSDDTPTPTRVCRPHSPKISQPDHLADPIEIAAAGHAQLGQHVEGAQAHRLDALFGGKVLAEPADVFQLAVQEGDLARDHHQVARDHIGKVAGHRRRSLRQVDPEFGETRFDFSSHDRPLPSLVRGRRSLAAAFGPCCCAFKRDDKGQRIDRTNSKMISID
jgi:hypothetical protein